MTRLILFASTVTLIFAGFATPQAEGQVIFLPSFRNFTVRGSVSVPDGGTITLGGVNRSSEGSVSNGVPGLGNLPGLGRGFKNKGIGRETESAGLTVKPTILIMEELEARHLAQAKNAAGRNAVNDEVSRKAAFLSKHIGRNDSRRESPGYRK